MTKVYNNNLATKQGLSFDEIISEINTPNTAIQIWYRFDEYADTKLGFGKKFVALLNKINTKDASVVQYLVSASGDEESVAKDVKKFRRQFRKETGHSISDKRFSYTDNVKWCCYIK